MSETRYIISDAAKMINVEPHVLRYWEEELGMDIPRNEMGHRYYTDREVRLFTQVRDLKEKGFQLKAIKMILSTLSEDMPASNIISLEKVRKGYEDEDHAPLEEPQAAVTAFDGRDEDMGKAETEKERHEPETPALTEDKDLALTRNTDVQSLSSEEKMKHFKYIMDGIVMQALKKNNQLLEEQVAGKVIKEMDYMFRVQEEKDEERFRNLDEMIRKKQKGRKEAAAARIPSYAKPKTKKRFFGKKEPF